MCWVTKGREILSKFNCAWPLECGGAKATSMHLRENEADLHRLPFLLGWLSAGEEWRRRVRGCR